MSFNAILEKYRNNAFSARDQGDRFERLMQAYLLTDPQYAGLFRKVWLWNEFPGKSDLGGGDTGIDLVAVTHHNAYWAIQCKCYKETTQSTASLQPPAGSSGEKTNKLPALRSASGFPLPTTGGPMQKKHSRIYNRHFTISQIPEKAYAYVVNGKSAIEWIMERYQVSTHKESGIVNDPNDWAKEVGNPRYILDLLLSIINVSVQTVDIVNSLPKVDFGAEPTDNNVIKMYPTREDENISIAAEPDHDE